VILFCENYTQAQEAKFKHFTTDQGLSANTILCLFQDSKGFLWIGTYNGLNKYDGYKFTIYKNSIGNPNSISDNKIRAICEDGDDNLWIGTWGGGLNKFNRSLENFTVFKHNPDDPNSISTNNILSLCFEKSGNLWIGNEETGLDYFNPASGVFHHFKPDPINKNSLSGYKIYTIYIDNNNVLWIGTADSGLNMFDKKENRFIRIGDSDYEGISSDRITSIDEDQQGNLWIGTEDGGLIQYNTITKTFTNYKHDKNNHKSISDDDIWSVFVDSKHFIWASGENEGLNLFDPVNKIFTHYGKDYSNPNSLSDNDIFAITEDRSGIMWFGTWAGGLNKFDRMQNKFTTYNTNPNDPNSLSSNLVYAIYKDKIGELWVGTVGGGVNRIDETNNKYIHYKYNPENKNSISSNNVYSICEDRDGYIWIGTSDAGINRFNRKNNKFKRYQHNPTDFSSLSTNEVSILFCDSYGDVWIGVGNLGLDRLKKDKDEFKHYRPDPTNPKSIKPNLVYSFYEDKARNLWIGTYGGGLMRYNRQTDDFSFFEHNPKSKNSFSSNLISTICEDEDGILWIGTDGAGLNKFDLENNQIKQYLETDGLPNDIVYGILSDNSGNLWISTGNGISKFNLSEESFFNYDKSDGLQDNEFNNWAYFKSSNGDLYFGGPNGVNRFNPNELTKNSYIPPIVITDFQILHKPVAIGYDSTWNRTILKKSISETKQLELNYDDNIISFEFAALDFRNPEKNQYAYFLEGFDKDWIHTNAQKRYVTYTNLDPGEYNFKLKASNNDGVWNEEGISLAINIHFPWWATWWAYIMYGIVTVLIFTGFTRFYLNRERLKTQLELEHDHALKLEEVDKMKSNFYANISHEFRTPLMLILGPVEKLLSKLADDESRKQAGVIRSNANRLLNLINQLLDLSKIEADKLKLSPSKNNISQFIKGLVKEFDSIADQRDISLRIIVEQENIEVYFDKEKLEKVITNVMSNAIKFTPGGGRITVKVAKTSESEVEITVRDSGIGIPKSEILKIFDRFYQVDGSHTREHEGTGIGLALTKEYVELHKGQISIDSVEGHWTEVKIFLPIGRSHLSDDEIVESTEIKTSKIESIAEYGLDNLNVEEFEKEDLVNKTIVLIVEDNVDLREYIRNDLKSLYHVEEAANGEQGIRKAEKCIPDLIVSDVMMPLMDGYEMTRKLRQDEKTSHIPIILLTAKSDKNSKLEGLGLGADDYLTKPFDTEELLARIKNLIETRRLLQERFGSGKVELHKPEKEKLNYLDQQFLDRVFSVINEHISEEGFSIEEFGKDVGMSRSQMHRKLKALTGKSTSLYLRTVRLAKAKEMIEQKRSSISEISYQVGFSSPAYFSRCFREEFGYPPSEVN